ncbi:MAG: hypothetical protein ABSE18_00465 [Minisyncoccia bacterium]|jgi:ABC-type Na+ efflux pump permease subunit
MEDIKNLAVGAIGSLTISLIAAANAATLPTSTITSTADITTLLCDVLNWVYWGLIVVGIMMLLMGGYRYATSAGDPEGVSKANKTLLYAVIAIVVALVAKGVPFIIGSIFSVPSSNLSVCP